MASEIRVNKIENRSGLGTVTFADTGVDLAGIVTATTFSGSGASLTSLPAAQVTGTLPAISGANLTNLPAANLTGTLPAISGANLTGIAATDNVRTGILDVAGIATFRNDVNVGTAVTITESGIEATGVGITCANINGTQIGGRRNIIINGAMKVAQRGTSFASLGSEYTVDRFRYTENIDSGVVTVTQESVTDLAGFTKAVKINCTTAETGVPAKAGSKFAALNTKLEGQDLQQLAYGTSGAKQITISFYVKSNITGTFCLSLYKGDQTDRNVSLGYTISSANTWEKKELTFPADTGGGGIDNDNGSGLELYWIVARQQGYQGTASTTWGDNADPRFANLCTATIFENTNDHIMFTGVQLEVGSQATPFEHRSMGEELALCQRYYFKLGKLDYLGTHMSAGEVYGIGMSDNDNVNIYAMVNFPVRMRDAPSAVEQSGSAGDYRVRRDTTKACSGVPTFVEAAEHYARINFPSSSHGWGTGQMLWCMSAGSSGYLGFSAEL